MATSRFFAINVTAMAIIHYISSNCKHFLKKLCTNHICPICRYILFIFLYFFPAAVTVTVIFIFFFNLEEVLTVSFPLFVFFVE